MKSKELDNLLNEVSAGIRSEQIDDHLVTEASARVWARLQNGATAPLMANAAENAAAGVEQIESCADFQTLMPAYLGGRLSEARALLLVDHTHECIPCRRALKQARANRVAAAIPAQRTPQRRANGYSLSPVVKRW